MFYPSAAPGHPNRFSMPMMDPSEWTPVTLPDDTPRLIVLIDTEEEFDWRRPLARENTATTAIKAQHRAHRVFEKYGIRPIYVVDYPVASRDDGWRPLRELHDDGLCDIGAHLHPWVNPPHEEDVDNFHSYPGNLPVRLEREKLVRLTAAIEDRFGLRPTVYKAGRYGVGPATGEILRELAYEIDTSVVPRTDLRRFDGPDFTRHGAHPFWIGPGRRLLEIPMSVGFAGLLSGVGHRLYRRLATRRGRALRLPGVFARLGLLERITLTPEGIVHGEHRRLTEAMLRAGHRVFSFTYHSPSLAPGNTPYVTSEAGLADFLDRFERYFDYFFGELGGQPTTPAALKAMLAS